MKRIPKWLSIIPLILAIGGAAYMYQQALVQPSFLGLPTVPCINPTLPVVQDYTLHISISISGRPYPLSPSIGHDPGNCLRVVHTNDSSGLVYVHTNDHVQYTLGNFFQAWRTVFGKGQFAGYRVTAGHSLQVLVNGSQVDTYSATPLEPNANIEVVYQ